MTMLRWTLGVLLCAGLLATPAFAESDAGTGVPADATATTDGGSTDAGGDAVNPPSDATGTGDSYTVNPCWAEKCPTEVAACKADATCDGWAKCVKSGKSADECGTELKVSEVPAKFNEILNCGWKACADPNAGSCAAPGKNGAQNRCGQYDDNWKCNCDDACTQFGDCCADKDSVCVGSVGTCKDQCGQFLGKDVCNCDSECEGANDCCPDYKELCDNGGSCTPACDGKQCGPDGCGGNCGSCPGGSTCNAGAGKCESGGGGGTDASAGGDSAGGGGGGATDAAGTDGTGTGTGGTGGTATPTNASGSSSGCTAAPSSNGAAGLLLVLGLVFGLVAFRRRFA